jgi:hypothetical protein
MLLQVYLFVDQENKVMKLAQQEKGISRPNPTPWPCVGQVSAPTEKSSEQQGKRIEGPLIAAVVLPVVFGALVLVVIAAFVFRRYLQPRRGTRWLDRIRQNPNDT